MPAPGLENGFSDPIPATLVHQGPCPLLCPSPWQRLLKALPSLDITWVGPSDPAWPLR